MLSSIPKPKFLLDENVHSELQKFLKSESYSVKIGPKGTIDSEIAALSKKEKLILITNDSDFSKYSENQLFSLVWLRLPQNKPDELVKSFKKLLKENQKWQGKTITLSPSSWESIDL